MAKRRVAVLEEQNKRQKTAMEGMAAEFVCPISQELPVNPVLAEDGHVYEEAAITEWLSRNLTSPKTREPMGRRLLPALQVRNAIEQLVKSGSISGDKVATWQTQLQHEKKMKELRAAAAEGSGPALFSLGLAFSQGHYGQTVDKSKAFEWFKKAAEKEHIMGMAVTGEYLLLGRGIAPTAAEAWFFLGRAAQAGSDLACWKIATAYKNGKWGVGQDSAQAKVWLHKVCSRTCEHKHLKGEFVTKAQQMLQELNGS